MAVRSRVGSALRFLVVGGTTVLIDAVTYTVLSAVGMDYDLAKTIGFLTGAVFAYFANWRFTFGGRRSRWSELLFVLVYLGALVVNILLNGLVRAVDPASTLVAVLAFLVATGVSAVWNFTGMSLFVFQRSSPTASSTKQSAGAAASAPVSDERAVDPASSAQRAQQ